MITITHNILDRTMIVSATDPAWLVVALADLDELLIDHAHCEKKAAASAMSLVAGYPSHTELVRPNHGRLTDRLLLFGLIEARSHERLQLLAANVEDAPLRHFYSQLADAESRHAELFRELACLYDEPRAVEERLADLARAEAEIIATLPLEPRIH
jgi:tRNA-(ms[2]io[6]A)-hydroxylase